MYRYSYELDNKKKLLVLSFYFYINWNKTYKKIFDIFKLTRYNYKKLEILFN